MLYLIEVNDDRLMCRQVDILCLRFYSLSLVALFSNISVFSLGTYYIGRAFMPFVDNKIRRALFYDDSIIVHKFLIFQHMYPCALDILAA